MQEMQELLQLLIHSCRQRNKAHQSSIICLLHRQYLLHEPTANFGRQATVKIDNKLKRPLAVCR